MPTEISEQITPHEIQVVCISFIGMISYFQMKDSVRHLSPEEYTGFIEHLIFHGQYIISGINE